LKRRKVYRAGAAYLAVAFAMLEGADLAFPALRFGPGVYNTLVLVSLLGFPLVLALAWTFDVTGGGIRRTAPAGQASVAAGPDRWARPKAALVGAGFVAIVWLSVQLWQPLGLEDANGVPIDEPVLAVLPFDDLSPAGDQAWFVDGLHEEILNQLAMLRGIRLTPRASVAHFRNSQGTASAIADSLGARFILEGSVRSAGDSVQVTVRLNDAASEKHLWSESFGRAMSLEGLFSLQRDLANRVASSVGGTLAAGTGQTPGTAPTSKLEAYHAYLRGLYHFNLLEILPAIDALKRAVEIDPEFGRAHGKLARIYVGRNNYGGGVQGELFPLIRQHAQAAMRYAPDHPESRMAMVGVRWTLEWDWEAARQEVEAALALDPDFTDARLVLAEWHAVIAGNTDRGMEVLEEARRLDPFAVIVSYLRGSILADGRRYAEAAEEYRLLQAQAPEEWSFGLELASNLALAGRREEAREIITEVLPVLPSPRPVALAVPLARTGDTSAAREVLAAAVALKEVEGSVPASGIAQGYAALGEIEEALTWLEHSFDQEGGVYFLRKPVWDPLRGHSRFQAIWDRLGLPGDPPVVAPSG
jgi:TolB-like protein/Flp pilus assembly protein TadD